MKLLIANRGEIAIRVAAAAADLGVRTVGVHSEDDARSLHTCRADESAPLTGIGARAYLDIDQLLDVALEHGCDAVHPGYGFLSENASFARRCSDAGLVFVGPSAGTLELFGDKARARRLARQQDVPVLPGVEGPVSTADARQFLATLPEGSSMLIKAVGGGGGRGIRVVSRSDDLESAVERARSEAEAAFGVPDVFLEAFAAGARHVEVQIAADDHGAVVCLGDRDCSLQRRHQKLVEIAPAPLLPESLRQGLSEAATRLAKAARYRNLGTFEFLVRGESFFFIEANARIQVEHTVTEEVTGIDLVRLQLQIAEGVELSSVGLSESAIPRPRGFAVQARINMETMDADGLVRPAGGCLAAFDPPSGRGLRVDTHGYLGYKPSPSFDSLLAKLICHSPQGGHRSALRMARRALADFRIEGIATNVGFLHALIAHAGVGRWEVHTQFVDDHVSALVEAADVEARFLAPEDRPDPSARRVGGRVDGDDPLAVLDYGKTGGASPARGIGRSPAEMGAGGLRSAMQGTIVSIEVGVGDALRPDGLVLVMEAMKMEHEIRCADGGVVREVAVSVGDTVHEGQLLAVVEEREHQSAGGSGLEAVDLDEIRPDLAEVHARHAVTLDDARPDAVAKRRKTGQRTARENVDDLCDPGSFVEYGQLALTPGSGLPRERVIRSFLPTG